MFIKPLPKARQNERRPRVFGSTSTYRTGRIETGAPAECHCSGHGGPTAKGVMVDPAEVVNKIPDAHSEFEDTDKGSGDDDEAGNSGESTNEETGECVLSIPDRATYALCSTSKTLTADSI